MVLIKPFPSSTAQQTRGILSSPFLLSPLRTYESSSFVYLSSNFIRYSRPPVCSFFPSFAIWKLSYSSLSSHIGQSGVSSMNSPTSSKGTSLVFSCPLFFLRLPTRLLSPLLSLDPSGTISEPNLSELLSAPTVRVLPTYKADNLWSGIPQNVPETFESPWNLWVCLTGKEALQCCHSLSPADNAADSELVAVSYCW
eukprot:GHVS01060308.1.p1 GENE.GHVS01060308.1~~GHVS01060308.1.p1  ORF type:complete len:197 (+),score=19.80 GHVS01060308.1:306-896(+)